MNSIRLFNPLTGSELKQTIIKDFMTLVDNCQELSAHLTFPRVDYSIDLSIETYPMDKPIELKTGKSIGDANPKAVPLRKKATVKKALGETQETAPDAIREQGGMEVTVPTRSDTGQMVDAPRAPRTRVTVGKGSLPRSESVTGPATAPSEPSEDMLDESGMAIKVNSNA